MAFLFVIAVANLICAFALSTEIINPESRKCSDYCDKTFTPHTSDTTDLSTSCKRGCRMFQVLLFSNRKNETETHADCVKACTEAYHVDSELGACNDGCKHQTPFTKGSGQFEMIITDQSDPMYHYAHSMMDNMFHEMDHMHERMMGGFKDMGNWMGFNGGESDNDDAFGAKFSRLSQTLNRLLGRDPFDDEQSSATFRIEPQFNMDNFGEPARMPVFPVFGDHLKGDPGSKTDRNQPDPFVGVDDETLNPLYQFAHSFFRKHNGDGKDPETIWGPPAGRGHHTPMAEIFGTGHRVGNRLPNGDPIVHVKIIHQESSPDLDASTVDGIKDLIEHGTIRDLVDVKPHEPLPPLNAHYRLASHPDARQHGVVEDPADSWMTFLARRSRRLSVTTRWLLFLGMVLCIMSMIWICLAIMKTAPRTRLLMQPHMHPKMMGMYGDAEACPVKMAPPPPTTTLEPKVHIAAGKPTNDKTHLVDAEVRPPSEDGNEPPPYMA